MSDSSIKDIKSGKGLKPLQGENTPKSGVTMEHRSQDNQDNIKASQSNARITHETFSHHADGEKSGSDK